MAVQKLTTRTEWIMNIDFRPQKKKKSEEKTFYLIKTITHDREGAETITVMDMYGRIVKDSYTKKFVEDIWQLTQSPEEKKNQKT